MVIPHRTCVNRTFMCRLSAVPQSHGAATKPCGPQRPRRRCLAFRISLRGSIVKAKRCNQIVS
ncbi:hypothetical protein B0H19DRAFT_1183608, partial [Mycena capillaripes]